MQEVSYQTFPSVPQISADYVGDKSVGKKPSGLDYLLAGKEQAQI